MNWQSNTYEGKRHALRQDHLMTVVDDRKRWSTRRTIAVECAVSMLLWVLIFGLGWFCWALVA